MTNVDLFPPPRCYVEFDYSINCTTRKLENLQLLLKQQIHFGNTRIGNMVKTQVCHISQMYKMVRQQQIKRILVSRLGVH